MMQFVGLLDGEPGRFGITFPDCPGCAAMGETADEALENAVAALREWMGDRAAAGLPIIIPRGIDALRSDPAWSDEIAEAVLVGVPLLLDAGRTVRANVSFDAALLADIDSAARRRGLTRSAFLASAARDKIMATG